MTIQHPVLRGFSGTNWPQYEEEVRGFIKLLVDEGCKSYIEVGCRHGDTFHAVGKALPKGSLLIGVDLPGARSGKETGGRFPQSDQSLKVAASDLVGRGQKAHVIIGNSHDAKTVAEAGKFAPFDAVFIDGDHSPDGVRADWENYGPMGRMVAFHDIYEQKTNPTAIMRLFKEIRQGRRWVEFALNKLDRGIGVLWTD